MSHNRNKIHILGVVDGLSKNDYGSDNDSENISRELAPEDCNSIGNHPCGNQNNHYPQTYVAFKFDNKDNGWIESANKNTFCRIVLDHLFPQIIFWTKMKT